MKVFFIPAPMQDGKIRRTLSTWNLPSTNFCWDCTKELFSLSSPNCIPQVLGLDSMGYFSVDTCFQMILLFPNWWCCHCKNNQWLICILKSQNSLFFLAVAKFQCWMYYFIFPGLQCGVRQKRCKYEQASGHIARGKISCFRYENSASNQRFCFCFREGMGRQRISS